MLSNVRFYTIILSTFIGLSIPSFAADSTRIDNRTRTGLGAFGGFGMGYTELASKEAIEINLQGGIIYNKWLAAGIHAGTFFTLNPLKDEQTGEDASLLGGYGGVFVTPILYSNALVHVTFPVVIGFGAVSYELSDVTESVNVIEDSDRFWFFEPGMELEMNVLKFIRVAVGGYYRYTSKVKLNYETGGNPILPTNFLHNFSVGIKLKFGKF